MMSCLRSSLRWAVANREYLLTNPMDNVKLPPYRTAPKRPKVFTPEAIQAIFKRFPAGHPIHMPCALAYYTGMRLGECLALEWSNIDMTARTIRITGTCYDKKGVLKITATKTTSSTRTITLGSKLYAELKAQKLWQDKNQFQAGPFPVLFRPETSRTEEKTEEISEPLQHPSLILPLNIGSNT